MPKYEYYQDYVIKDGKLIGEFEQMYANHPDPWNQSMTHLSLSGDIGLNWCKKIRQINEPNRTLKIIEIGCGLGVVTNKFYQAGFNVLGVDISETAIEKAKKSYINCNFQTGDILEFNIYENFQPDIFVMSEITWYVLEKLDLFLNYLRENFKHSHLIHILTTYPKNVQRYGREYFTNLKEIMDYFNLNYFEHGYCSSKNGHTQTFFLATI